MQRLKCICSKNFTYVDSWDKKIITSQTYRQFSKKHPGREALDIFHNHLVKKYINNPTNLRKRVEVDLQK